MALVFLAFERVNAWVLPFDAETVDAVVAGVRPVCIQWRKACGFWSDGMSRSTMITAYEVPPRRDFVAIVGALAVAIVG